MSVKGIQDAYKTDIPVWGLNDIDVDPALVGLKASPTKVFKSFVNPPKGAGMMLEGTTKEKVESLFINRKDKHII